VDASRRRGGCFFAALIIVAGPVLSGSSPTLSASGQTIFDFVSAHRSHLKISAALAALAMTFFLLWLSGLFGLLRQATGGYPTPAVAAVAGGVLAASTGLGSAAVKAALACQIGEIGPGSARSVYTLVRFTNGGVLFGLMLVIGVTAVATYASPLVGRWFSLLSAALVVGSLVGAASIAYANSAIQKLGSAFLSLDALWVLVVCVLLWRRTAMHERSAP